MQNIEITWNLFASRHGKCEADGEAAVVKNPVYPTRLYNHIGKVGIRRIWAYKGYKCFTPYLVV